MEFAIGEPDPQLTVGETDPQLLEGFGVVPQSGAVSCSSPPEEWIDMGVINWVWIPLDGLNVDIDTNETYCLYVRTTNNVGLVSPVYMSTVSIPEFP